VDETGETDAVGSVRFSPNRFADSTELTLSLSAGTESATCALHDVSGRVVRTLETDAVSGEAQFVWDGLDARGVEVASGVYFAVLTAGALSAVQKLALLR
jgi:flagellar hook assembly protein FlgD